VFYFCKSFFYFFFCEAIFFIKVFIKVFIFVKVFFVKEYWKAGLNKTGRNIKSAQNKKVWPAYNLFL